MLPDPFSVLGEKPNLATRELPMVVESFTAGTEMA